MQFSLEGPTFVARLVVMRTASASFVEPRVQKKDREHYQVRQYC
jgi:hypothetical protein